MKSSTDLKYYQLYCPHVLNQSKNLQRFENDSQRTLPNRPLKSYMDINTTFPMA